MAARYWVGGTASWDGTALLKWATTSGGIGGAAVPTAADDVFFDGVSGAGNCTIAATVACRSINCTGYTGTITHTNVNNRLDVGDATAGAGNIALKFVAGMTYSGGGFINMISTSATQQTVDFAGKTTGPVDFNASGSTGNWLLTGAWTTTDQINHQRGTLNTNGQTVNCRNFRSSNSNVRTLTLGASAINCTGKDGGNWGWETGDPTNLTFNANTSVITLTGVGANFSGGGRTFNGLVLSAASGTNTLYGGGVVIADLTVPAGGTAAVAIADSMTITSMTLSPRTYTITAGKTITVGASGLTARGSSGSLITILSSSAGSAFTFTMPSGGADCDWLSLKDSTATGGAAWYAGANSTNVSGNTGWIFTAAPRPRPCISQQAASQRASVI